MNSKLTRRHFFFGASALAAARPARPQSANNKVVLALIGAGGRGSDLARKLQNVENVEFKYVCEVNDERGEEIASHLESVRGFRPQRVLDMRRTFDDKDVDGVIITTPEHWHALATVWACQAAKDVYVEKCVSLTVWEGRKMIEAARKYKRVVQCGTQNRSAPYSNSAREYIASGQLGKVLYVKVFNLLPGTGDWAPLKPLPDGPPPEGLDWDAFLGPAPVAPYNRNRIDHWETYWHYGGGPLSSDASHQLDLARKVLGDPPHPKSVYATGGRFAADDGREAPDTQAVTYDYGDFVMTCDSGTFTPYIKKFPNEIRNGTTWPVWNHHSTRVEIYGTKRIMYLGRHGVGWQVMEEDGKVVAQDKGVHPDKWHQPNFIDSIRSRERPNSDIEQGHYSSCAIHLGKQAVTYDYGDFVMTCDSGTFTPYIKKFPNEIRNGTTWPVWNHHSTRVEIYGTKRIMYLGRHGVGWQVMEEDGKVVAQDKGVHPDKWHQPNFIDCIRSRARPNSDIEQGHYSSCAIHLGNLAYRAGNKHLTFDGEAERFTNSDWANGQLKPAYRKHYRIPEEV